MKGLFSREMNELSWANTNVMKTSNRPLALMKTDVKSHIEPESWCGDCPNKGIIHYRQPDCWVYSRFSYFLYAKFRRRVCWYHSSSKRSIHQGDSRFIGHLLLQTTQSCCCLLSKLTALMSFFLPSSSYYYLQLKRAMSIMCIKKITNWKAQW